MTNIARRISIFLTAALLALAPASAQDNEVSNEVRVVTHPHPIYPAVAALSGMEGRCLTKFRLLDYGETLIVDGVICSAPIFCLPSRNALQGAEFQVIDVEGTLTPGARDAIFYPFRFAQGDDMRDIPDEELVECEFPDSDETTS